MISVEELEALDLSLWLKTGEHAANMLHCNQSTISRRKLKVLSVFDASRGRTKAIWDMKSSSQSLLKMEREVHQWYRLTKTSKLRIQIPYWSYGILRPILPENILCNPPFSSVLCDNPLELLRSRIIDGCILTPTQLKDVFCDDLEIIGLYKSQINLYHLPPPERSSSPIARPSLFHDDCRLVVAPFLPDSCRISCAQRYLDLTACSEPETSGSEFQFDLSFLTPLMASTFDNAIEMDDQLNWQYKEYFVVLKSLSLHSQIQNIADLIRQAFAISPVGLELF
jgi:hypothetical protein